ncbi:MAG: DUF2892 domain-containing protein [Mariprofundales bacterium]|nr:DUF2892 domain-containing protein [Mariprofundales bacterium]
MKANVGGIDRGVRLLAGLALAAFGVLGSLESPWSMVAIGAGAVFVLTSVIKFCPLYTVLGINSCSAE